MILGPNFERFSYNFFTGRTKIFQKPSLYEYHDLYKKHLHLMVGERLIQLLQTEFHGHINYRKLWNLQPL